MKLIYITADPYQAGIANQSHIDYVMVDLEINGKRERQRGRDTLISNHSVEDVRSIRGVLHHTKLLVRVNPIWKKSKEEIDQAIYYGADALMLPMFRTKEEVSKFLELVNGRVECQLLLETSSGLEKIESILDLEGISTIHVGLNDLHQELKFEFMFELFIGDILETLSTKVIARGVNFGIGGIGRLDADQLVSPELILREHLRLKSSQVILSRDFKRIFLEADSKHLQLLQDAVSQIRTYFSEIEISNPVGGLSKGKLVENISIARKKIGNPN
jgi:2-keto-3-deoxy-L-rhamnonate aldolase RhmA